MRLGIFTRLRSITLRLTLLFAAISTGVLLLLGLVIGASVEQHFEEMDMEVLAGKLELTRHALERVRREPELAAIPQQLDDSLVGHPGLVIIVLAPNGETLFATNGAAFPQSLQGVRTSVSERPTTWKNEDKSFRGITALAPTGIEGARPATVSVATDISSHEHFMASFRKALWSFVLFAAALTGFLGWVAVRRGLRPLQEIRAKAASVTARKLDARIDVEAVPLELVPLAESFNAMLSRLEDSFARLSDFSSDLAHEFRTPISNLMTQTQVTLAKARSREEYCEILASNVEEFERLSHMIADMLFIAQADEGRIVPRKEKIELAGIVEELVDFYRLLAEEKGIALFHAGGAPISGDRLMLRRALSNLIANALKHTPPGGRITVRCAPDLAGAAVLAVENTGETIAAPHLPRLFDRFYRVDASRQRSSEGAGLGLAITRSIAQAHGGKVDVRSQDGVTVFELVLPS